MTDKIHVGEKIVTVLDVPGHMEEYVEMVEKVIQTTEVVKNPVVEKVVNASGKLSEQYLFGGIEAQREKLEAEGIDVVDYRVNLDMYGWHDNN